jgi:Tfp pilus assembly protein PilV
MSRASTLRQRIAGSLARCVRAESGSLLIEVMVSATIVLIVGFGVLAMVDRTTQLSAEQRSQAIAGNLAQVEIDRVKGLPLSELSNLRSSTPKFVAGVKYDITTRADWMDDTAMAPSCTTPGAKADYLKVQTSVTHAGMGTARPAVLDTLVSPPVRAFEANQGALALLVEDQAGKPVTGATVSLTGPATFTDTTSANGCILWSYLPAGSGYAVAVSKAGYVTPSGVAKAGGSTSVVGDATTNASYEYDRGGSIRTSFKVRDATGALIATSPKLATVENGTGAGLSKTYDLGTASSLDTASQGLLFPFANPYAIYAGCASNKPPAPTPAALTPGGSIQAADTVLPALHVTVLDGSSPVVGATVSVATGCGNMVVRRTNAQGQLDDPGFPYGTGLTVCATDGATRKRVVSGQANTNVTTGTTVSIQLNGGAKTNLSACP